MDTYPAKTFEGFFPDFWPGAHRPLTGRRCGACLRPIEQAHKIIPASFTRGNWGHVRGNLLVHAACADPRDVAAA